MKQASFLSSRFKQAKPKTNLPAVGEFLMFYEIMYKKSMRENFTRNLTRKVFKNAKPFLTFRFIWLEIFKIIQK